MDLDSTQSECSLPRSDRLGNDSIRDRARVAQAMLKRCTFCELRCGVDRTRHEPCPCHLGTETYRYKQYVSLHAESSRTPSLRVFLGGCNFRCRFCDEGSDCFQPKVGEAIDTDRFAEELEGHLDAGIQAISLIGGEASLHAHTILATAAAATRPLPLVLNSNMYMTPEVLDLLDGVVTVYLADFKFGNNACAKNLAGVPRYMEVVCRNLQYAAQSTPVIVRHLLIPGHFDCCFRPLVDWLAATLPTLSFQLYTGYVPCWRASTDRTIGRLNSRSGVEQASEYMQAHLADSAVMDERRGNEPTQNLHSQADVSMTLGVDGRIYCHDLTPELAGIARELCCQTNDTNTEQKPYANNAGSDR